jgi:outer membrane protein, heavy metal efflux system
MRVCFLLLFAGCYFSSSAADTLRFTLPQAEAQFLKRNLLLLASRFDVEAQTALVIQARLWDNPVISTELNAYHPEREKYFDVGRQGQKIFALEQLIVLGGKRKGQVSLARQQAQMASLSFENLLRNLRFELRRSFYSIYYDSETLRRYTQQLSLLSSIIAAYEVQSSKGNIPLKEVLRLKAAYYKLNNNKTELINSILNEEANLKILLGEDAFIEPVWDGATTRYVAETLQEELLVQEALQARPDYKEVRLSAHASETYWKLQKSMAVPDLMIGGVYDQRGGAFNNQIGLSLAMNLPLWNRNQGNIKASGFLMERSKLLAEQKEMEIKAEVATSYQKLLRVEQEFRNIDETFRGDFEQLNQGVMVNFQKRNLSLLEFVDFFESYNENLQELNKLQKARIQAFEELNAAVGVELYN